jgi:tetratricopeptide (TPR) repeat protein
MNKLIFIFFSLIFFVNANANVKETFDNGNKAFKAKDYATAALLFDNLIVSGVEDASVYYNLGNAYYKLNNFSGAIFNYEKARKLKPNQEDINNNLQMAYQQMSAIHPEVNMQYEQGFVNTLISKYSPSQWSKGMLICLWAGVFLFVYFLYTKNDKTRRLTLITSSISLVMCIVLLSFTFLRIHNDKAFAFAIVHQIETTSKTEPFHNANTVSILSEGQKVLIIDRNGEWIKVRNNDGEEGWLAKATIKEI